MPVIESIDNIIQLVTTGFCTAFSACRLVATKRREWAILTLAGAVCFLGDLYWQLYLLFYGKTPEYSYKSYIGWYAGYLFLSLLVVEIRGERKAKYNRWLFLVPAFTIGMGIFYLQWGDLIGNIISATLMGILIWVSVDALIMAKNEKKKESVFLYITILIFCFAEYAMWTASCFWQGDTFMNPYFWFDILMSSVFLALPFALKKAVKYE